MFIVKRQPLATLVLENPMSYTGSLREWRCSSWDLHDVDDLPNRKSDGHLMLDSVRSILSSDRSDDTISGELAELLGFDELELVLDILSDRSQFLEQPRVVNPPAPVPQKGKGKGIGNTPGDVAETSVNGIALDSRSLAPDQARRRMEEQLQANASRPLFTGVAVSQLGFIARNGSY